MSEISVATSLAVNTGNRLYKSRTKSLNMYTTTGRRIIFINGLFQTNDEEFIEYLDNEIKKGVHDVYIDKDEMYFDPAKYDIREALKREIRLELEREAIMKASGNPNKDMGTSEQGKLNTTNTQNLASVAAGGGPSGKILPVLTVPSVTK
jgi:hypothetical protein